MVSSLADPVLLGHAHSQQAYVRARSVNIQLARVDGATFNAVVLRDELSGKPIKLAPTHYKWHDILDVEKRVVFFGHIESGKTNQLSIGRSLFELGKDPNLRIAVISKTQELASKIVVTAGQYISRSHDLREVFPNLRPTQDRSLPWNSTAITVERPSIAKDPSFQASGLHGGILGSRVDLMILDDVLDYDNTKTAHNREDVWKWLNSSDALGRLTENARVWILGNAWHPKDAMHQFAKLPRYRAYKFPVLDEKGQPSWPEKWSLERIEGARLDKHPADFARQLMCVATDEDASVFKQEWIDVALAQGQGYDLVNEIDTDRDPLPPGFFVVTGVDLASRKSETADLTVMFTALVHPDGVMQVLSIRAERLHGPEIVSAIGEVHRRFGGVVIVENNGAQDFICQFAVQRTAAAIVPYTTTAAKVDPGIGISAIAVDMRNGKWIIPNNDGKRSKEVDMWINEMLSYSPNDHTGDILMASWFVREYVRRHLVTEDEGTADVQVTVL